MKMRDYIIATLLSILAIICIVVACIGAAIAVVRLVENGAHEVEPPPANFVIEETNFVIDQFDDEIEPPEDPHESEKIEAALDWHYIEDCELTAYCPCSACCGKDNGITATGTVAQEGVTIAVDSDIIPLGSWVEIDGHTYHAEDVGGAVNGNHIDIYFDSHDAAWDFGHRYADVRWYEGLEE